MAGDILGEGFDQVENECSKKASIENFPYSSTIEPNLALVDYGDGIWVSDSFTSACTAIKDRYIRTNDRLKKFTSADILACIKFENTEDDDVRRKQKRNRRVRFSTGMSISVDSLVQCNSEHNTEGRDDREQNDPTDSVERQFLEEDFLNVPPHRHLTTGENKICNAYFDDIKTVGYGRRCLNPYPFYNNSFDPRLRFDGLQNELNLANAVTEYGDYKHTDNFNCALTLLQDPAEFLDTYMNSYRNYLKSLDAVVHVPNDLESEAVEESESSVNIQEASDIDSEESKLLQKIESVRSLWSSHTEGPSNPSEFKAPELEGKDGKADVIQINPVDADIENISEALNSLHIGQHIDSAPRTSTPKFHHSSNELRVDEKFIVHTTCLSSDGQSTETLIHETILKPPLAKLSKHDTTSDSPRRDDSYEEDKYSVCNPDLAVDGSYRSPRKSPEDYEDDSDGTLTPGEEETEARISPEKETLLEPRFILRRGQTTGLATVCRPGSDSKTQDDVQRVRSPATLTIETSCQQIPPNRNTSQPDSHVEPRRHTRLSATTEPFIPTSQKIYEQSTTPAVTVDENGATAKQTTAPTNNGPIYQTSDMFKSAPAAVSVSTAADVSRQPPVYWYSLPVQQHNASDQPSTPYLMNSHQEPQVLHQKRNPLLPPLNRHQNPPPGFQQEHLGVRHQRPHHVTQQSQTSAWPGLPQSQQPGNFATQAPPLSPSQYHKIPVHTSTCYPPTGNRNGRPKLRNISRIPQFAGNQHWTHRQNSLQGQPSNQQPVYNSFWLQFQNRPTCNSNFQPDIRMPPPQENQVPNFMASRQSNDCTQSVPQQYDFPPHMEPQCLGAKEMFQQPEMQQQSRSRCNDNQFQRPQSRHEHHSLPRLIPENQFRSQNQYEIMHQHSFQANGRANTNASSAHFCAGVPTFPFCSQDNTVAHVDMNSNNNATTDEEQSDTEVNLVMTREERDETDSCSIEVLENYRSREKHRALIKSSKPQRPIRSSLVQLV